MKPANKLRNRLLKQDGMVMIDLALLLLLGGLLIGGFVAGLRPIDRETQTEDTRAKMQKVIYAMAIYTQKYNKTPCAADPAGSGPEPFGTERGSGAAGTAKPTGANDCDDDDEVIGIVPFKTLGLTEDDARDEWGHYFTYRTSIKSGDQKKNGADLNVHELCRIEGVWVITKGGPNYNVDPEKAYFCCMRSESGFDVLDKDDDSYIPEAMADCKGSCGSVYNQVDVHKTTPSLKSDEIPDTLALVLVSHGRNGFGSYLRDGTQLNMDIAGQYSADERENADEDGGFVMIAPSREADSDYFDDIVMWRTQQMLMTELGGRYGNCENPTPGTAAPDAEGGPPDDKGGPPDDKGGPPDDKGGPPDDKGGHEK